MSTFYVLPTLQTLGRQFAGFLTGLFPGLDWTALAPTCLAETLTSLVEARNDVIVIHREDLGDAADLERVLIDDYGAERGDVIVESGQFEGSAPTPARVWRITAASVQGQRPALHAASAAA